jgi:hypothetical protein
MQSLVCVMQGIRLKIYVQCVEHVFVVNTVTRELYFRYAESRIGGFWISAGSKHAKISSVGTNESGLCISRDSSDFSDDLELIFDSEGNNVGDGGPGRQVQQ